MSGCTAALALAFLLVPGTSEAAVTIGSNLADTPNGGAGCNPPLCTLALASLPPASTASGGLLAPSNGVVVRWRVKVANNATPIALRITRPGSSDTRTGAGTGPTVRPATFATSTFDVRLPIQAGDALGIDCCVDNGIATTFDAFNATVGGASYDGWNMGLGDGSAPRLSDNGLPWELLINADVEPDADGDGFGDESQDKCVGTSGPQDGCPPPDNTKPVATFSAARKQNLVANKGFVVNLQSNEAGSVSATGTVSVPNASKVYALTPANANLAANVKTRLTIKLSSRSLRKAKRALRRRKKVTGTVNLIIKDAAGNATTGALKLSQKGKRKKKRR